MRFNYLYILLIIGIIQSCSNNNSTNEYAVKKGKFEAAITETGDLAAVNSRLVTMPFVDWRFSYDFKILAIKNNGIQVKKGDTIAVIDNASALKAIADMQTRIDAEIATFNKLEINYTTQEQSLKTDLQIREANYNATRLQVDKSKFETDKKQKIKSLELEKATIDFDMAKKRMKAQLSNADKQIKIQRIRIKRMESDMKISQKSLELFILRSPGNGILQLSRNRENGQIYKVGDKVRRFAEIASVPDLSKMKVISTINETDIGKISVHQPVTVRLDAYSSVSFEGYISTISKTCHKKDSESNIKVFDFEVIVNKSDPLLKPGMTVSCEIFYAKLKNTIYVSNSCIHFTDSSQFVILEKDKKKIPISLGPGNSRYTSVNTELPVGEILVPFETSTSKDKK